MTAWLIQNFLQAQFTMSGDLGLKTKTRMSNPRPPDEESRFLLTELPAPLGLGYTDKTLPPVTVESINLSLAIHLVYCPESDRLRLFGLA